MYFSGSGVGGESDFITKFDGLSGRGFSVF